MSPELRNLISASIITCGGIVISIICCLVPRIRKEKLEKSQRELLSLYRDVQEFLKEEQAYMDSTGQSKVAVRKNLSISNKCEPKRIEERIRTLESQVG